MHHRIYFDIYLFFPLHITAFDNFHGSLRLFQTHQSKKQCQNVSVLYISVNTQLYKGLSEYTEYLGIFYVKKLLVELQGYWSDLDQTEIKKNQNYRKIFTNKIKKASRAKMRLKQAEE